MNTNNSLAFMQAVATFSLLLCLGLAYVINPIDESLFFQATSSFVSAMYGNDVPVSYTHLTLPTILLV